MKSTQIILGRIALMGALVVMLPLNEARASSGEVSFTPTGLKLPIMKITLTDADGANGTTLYSCPAGTAEGCMVDLSSQADLDALAAVARTNPIDVGTYSLVSLSTCVEGTSGSDMTTAYVKGSFTVGATTYYTDSDATNASGVSSALSAAAFTQVGNWGCSTKNVRLNPPVTVTAGAAVDLQVLVDNSFAAFSTSNTSSGMGGCKAALGGGRGVCVTYPALLPVVGSGTASTRHFKLAHHATSSGSIDDTKANSIVVVALDGASTPVMAFGRQFYSETSAAQSNNTAPVDATFGGPSFVTETQYRTFAVNADGSVAFEQGGSADLYAAKFSAFQLSTHSGTESTKSNVSWFYHAVSY